MPCDERHPDAVLAEGHRHGVPAAGALDAGQRIQRRYSRQARPRPRRRDAVLQETKMSYPGGYKYTKDHEWIELSGDRGKVGITEYAQQQLGDVVYVELPEVGAQLKQGQSFGTIESVKAVSELYSPVTGEVVEVNAALKDKPETVNKDPHGSWMIVIRMTNAGESAELLDAAQYEKVIS